MKTVNIIGALILIVIITMAAIKPPVNEEFKNLQVLPKNITSDSLIKVMDAFCEALSVSCDNCHKRDKVTKEMIYEKDDKPEKEIARLMLKMTNDLNQNYFKHNESEKNITIQSVTCYTCHKGEVRPPTSPHKK